MSLLLQIFDALPHLRSAKLPYSCFSRVLRSEPDTAPWLTDSRPRSLEELHVGAIAGTTVPVVLDLLSAFARISKLTFSCRVLSTSGGSQSYPPSPTLEVHSLTIRGRCDGLALQELQGFVKLNAIRDLSLSTSPTPAQPTLISFLQSIASLTSLEYRVDRMAAPAGLPVNVHLRSVRIFAELPVWRSKDMRSEQALLEMSEWGPAMRDLEVMVTADTRDVHITLTVVDTCITYVSPEGSDSDLFDDPEEIATAQERTFSRLDWKRLENIAQRWPTVETLRIWVIYQDAELATRCIGILRNAASRNLSSGVAGRLLINQTPYVSILHSCSSPELTFVNLLCRCPSSYGCHDTSGQIARPSKARSRYRPSPRCYTCAQIQISNCQTSTIGTTLRGRPVPSNYLLLE